MACKTNGFVFRQRKTQVLRTPNESGEGVIEGGILRPRLVPLHTFRALPGAWYVVRPPPPSPLYLTLKLQAHPLHRRGTYSFSQPPPPYPYWGPLGGVQHGMSNFRNNLVLQISALDFKSQFEGMSFVMSFFFPSCRKSGLGNNVIALSNLRVKSPSVMSARLGPWNEDPRVAASAHASLRLWAGRLRRAYLAKLTPPPTGKKG